MSGRFEAIYCQHVSAIFRFAVCCVGRREIAEEITSEAFLALYRNLGSIDETQLPGWLITVARNRARDYWRRRTVEQKFLEGLQNQPCFESNASWKWLLDAPELKPIHRICLTMRYVEELTRSEIAEKLGLSEIQVKGHLQYGLQLLRKAAAGTIRT